MHQVELFCVNHLINCSLESTEEFISMEFRFTLRDNGMRAAFQLLHMVLEVNILPIVTVKLFLIHVSCIYKGAYQVRGVIYYESERNQSMPYNHT